MAKKSRRRVNVAEVTKAGRSWAVRWWDCVGDEHLTGPWASEAEAQRRADAIIAGYREQQDAWRRFVTRRVQC